jgi:hypothetical protein
MHGSFLAFCWRGWLGMTVESGLQQLLTTLDSQNRSRESSDMVYGEWAAAVSCFTPCNQLICIGWSKEGSSEDRWWGRKGVYSSGMSYFSELQRGMLLFFCANALQRVFLELWMTCLRFCLPIDVAEDWFVSHLPSDHHLCNSTKIRSRSQTVRLEGSLIN